MAKKLECHVVAGYPEKLTVEESRDPERPHLVGANSAVIYGPTGEWVGGYRKTNLFETDQTWALPGMFTRHLTKMITQTSVGTGFATFTLPSPLRTITLGICMDLNAHPPAQWTTIDGPYEIADHTATTKSNILILLNAWLDSRESEQGDREEDPDWSTLNYWASRLRPLYIDRPQVDESEKGRETMVVVCNRTGTENGVHTSEV